MQEIKALPSVSIEYVPAEKRYFWPNHQDGMKSLEKNGYFRVNKPGERLLMNKPASVKVLFNFFGTLISYDAKHDVMRLYGLQKISAKAAKIFKHDVLNGSVVLSMKDGKMQFVKLEKDIKQLELSF